MEQFNSYKKSQQMALENAPANKVEAWALTEAARRLAQSKNQDKEDMIEQVRLNWRIWTIIQSELVDPDCTIPIEIRQNLLNLSNFIDRRSIDFIAKPDPPKLDILININRQIAGGLSGSPSGDAPQADTPQEEQTSHHSTNKQLEKAQESEKLSSSFDFEA